MHDLERHIVDHLISIMQFHHMRVKKYISGYCGKNNWNKKGHGYLKKNWHQLT